MKSKPQPCYREGKRRPPACKVPAGTVWRLLPSRALSVASQMYDGSFRWVDLDEPDADSLLDAMYEYFQLQHQSDHEFDGGCFGPRSATLEQQRIRARGLAVAMLEMMAAKTGRLRSK